MEIAVFRAWLFLTALCRLQSTELVTQERKSKHWVNNCHEYGVIQTSVKSNRNKPTEGF